MAKSLRNSRTALVHCMFKGYQDKTFKFKGITA